jgi:hypothetical protein
MIINSNNANAVSRQPTRYRFACNCEAHHERAATKARAR